MIDAKPLSRSFTYNGVKLPDPDPGIIPEDVKAAYSHQYPELATAAITGPEASGELWRGGLCSVSLRRLRWP
jgi:PRTRC genetic system protein C